MVSKNNKRINNWKENLVREKRGRQTNKWLLKSVMTSIWNNKKGDLFIGKWNFFQLFFCRSNVINHREKWITVFWGKNSRKHANLLINVPHWVNSWNPNKKSRRLLINFKCSDIKHDPTYFRVVNSLRFLSFLMHTKVVSLLQLVF